MTRQDAPNTKLAGFHAFFLRVNVTASLPSVPTSSRPELSPSLDPSVVGTVDPIDLFIQ